MGKMGENGRLEVNRERGLWEIGCLCEMFIDSEGSSCVSSSVVIAGDVFECVNTRCLYECICKIS